MSAESELYYICKPTDVRPVRLPVEFLTVQEFLADEPCCKTVWEMIAHQFRTRSKFLAIWQGVRYVAVHRDAAGRVDGFLFVTTPVNWQIDYVVVRSESRGQGIASALVQAALKQAHLHKTPYVMLTSKESLRPLYESCGFEVVRSHCPV
jgi:GNAT superfamily N-acetyltransferase